MRTLLTGAFVGYREAVFGVPGLGVWVAPGFRVQGATIAFVRGVRERRHRGAARKRPREAPGEAVFWVPFCAVNNVIIGLMIN